MIKYRTGLKGRKRVVKKKLRNRLIIHGYSIITTFWDKTHLVLGCDPAEPGSDKTIYQEMFIDEANDFSEVLEKAEIRAFDKIREDAAIISSVNKDFFTKVDKDQPITATEIMIRRRDNGRK